MDLNISIDEKNNRNGLLKNVLERSFEFGFECVAINTTVESSKLSGKNISIPEPKSIDFSVKSTRQFRILNRITAIIEDNIHSHHFLRSPVTKKYDILAVQPVGEKMLQHACSTLNVDIISLDLSENLGFSLKRTTIRQAIKRGICFEILYAPCIRDQTSKRNIISNGQLLVEVSKEKNIVVSSGASKPLEIRGVEDVVNLALLFGFKRNGAEASVRKNGQLVLKHAGTRNETGCGFVSLSGLYRLPKHQGWIVHACKVPKLSEIAASTQKRPKEAGDKEGRATKKCKVEEDDSE